MRVPRTVDSKGTIYDDHVGSVVLCSKNFIVDKAILYTETAVAPAIDAWNYKRPNVIPYPHQGLFEGVSIDTGGTPRFVQKMTIAYNGSKETIHAT